MGKCESGLQHQGDKHDPAYLSRVCGFGLFHEANRRPAQHRVARADAKPADAGHDRIDLANNFEFPADLTLRRQFAQDLALHVPQQTIEAIRARGPEVLVLQSEKAVAEYNARCTREPVVALIHSTC